MPDMGGDWLAQLVAAARAEKFDLGTPRSSARTRGKVRLVGQAKNRQPITVEVINLDRFTPDELLDPAVIAGLVAAVHRWCRPATTGETRIVNAIDVLARLGFDV